MIMKKEDIINEMQLVIDWANMELSRLTDAPEDEERKRIVNMLIARQMQSKYDFIDAYNDAKERRAKEDLDDNK